MTAKIIDLKIAILDEEGKKVVFEENIFTAKRIIDCMIRDEANQATQADRKTINQFIKQVGIQDYHPTPLVDVMIGMIGGAVAEYKGLTTA